MTLIELRDKIDEIIEETPSWANVERIGIVTNTEEDTGWKDMLWLKDFRPICCDGQRSFCVLVRARNQRG